MKLANTILFLQLILFNMWHNKLNGILGIWVITLAFLGFSDSLHRVLLIITGLVIAVFSFWPHRIVKPIEELKEFKNEVEPDKNIQNQE